jgi:hypothetical protein
MVRNTDKNTDMNRMNTVVDKDMRYRRISGNTGMKYNGHGRGCDRGGDCDGVRECCGGIYTYIV